MTVCTRTRPGRVCSSGSSAIDTSRCSTTSSDRGEGSTRRNRPAFTLAWNPLVGVPLPVPSFLYQGVHTDHHRQRSYGTDLDPEYVPFGRRPPLLIAGYVAASLLAPALFIIRFAVLAPLS